MEPLPPFHHLRPKTLAEAANLLSQHGQSAKVLAGGTDLLIQMKNRLTSPLYLVSLKEIQGLDEILEVSGEIRIGALATHSKIQCSPLIRKRLPVLGDSVDNLGSKQIRNVGTLGGNLCNAAPSADTASPLLALDARLKVVGTRSEKQIPVDSFFIGAGKTILEVGEILAEIIIPLPPSYSAGAFIKHTRRAALDLPVISVAVQCTFNAELSHFERVRIGLGVVAPVSFRPRKAESFLQGKRFEEKVLEEAGNIACQEATPRDTWRGSSLYRKAMIGILLQEALQMSKQRAAFYKEGSC
jgi:CO/xanthine dehydrogenase FAD-binding subunit